MRYDTTHKIEVAVRKIGVCGPEIIEIHLIARDTGHNEEAQAHVLQELEIVRNPDGDFRKRHCIGGTQRKRDILIVYSLVHAVRVAVILGRRKRGSQIGHSKRNCLHVRADVY